MIEHMSDTPPPDAPDPILLSKLSDPEYFRANYRQIADAALEGNLVDDLSPSTPPVPRGPQSPGGFDLETASMDEYRRHKRGV